MKKIIALALALIMALSMASVAFAAATPEANDYFYVVNGTTYDLETAGLAGVDTVVRPGNSYELLGTAMGLTLKDYKLSKIDFTTKELQGASLIDSIKITKENDAIRLTVKESYTMLEEVDKAAAGVITLTHKTEKETVDGKQVAKTVDIYVSFTMDNDGTTIDGGRKASEATEITSKANYVYAVEEGGYFTFKLGTELAGTFKAADDSKVYLNGDVVLKTADPDEYDALVAAFGEDYDGIVEMYTFETKAAEDVAFTYDAWDEDPHFFYAWDGEKLTQIDAKYDADEDVDDYVFTADAAGTIIVCDEEVVLAAEETKNPDTGANDVVGVAAALAVVSLVAAGAVSLKK